MTTVYVLTITTEGGDFADDNTWVEAVCATNESARAALVEYISNQVERGYDHLMDDGSFETMGDDDRISTYFKFWSSDSFEITEMEVRPCQGELIELQGLADYIDPGDVELLEPAGVPEFPDQDEPDSVTLTIVLSGEGTHYLAALQDLEDLHAVPLAEATGTTGREALLALIDKIDLPPFEDTTSLTDDVGFWTGL